MPPQAVQTGNAMKKKTLFGDILDSITKYFLILVGVVVLAVLLSCIRVVKSGNVALVLRFGKLVGNTYEEQVHEPGLFFAFPYMIDEVVTVPTGRVIEQSVTTHYTEGKIIGSQEGGGYLLTGDSNVAVMSASVKYSVSDPVAYALNTANVQGIINAAVSSAMLSEAAASDVDDLLTSGKAEFVQAILERTEAQLDPLGLGVSITNIELTQVAMAREVRDIYDQVNSATVQAATIQEQAQQYREQLIPIAQGDKTLKIANAQSNYSRQMAAARQDLYTFWGVLDEFEARPDVVKARIYAQQVTNAIQKIGTVRIVQDGETKIFLNP